MPFLKIRFASFLQNTIQDFCSFYSVDLGDLYSTTAPLALSAMRLVTSKPGGESIQHSDTSNVLACLAQRWAGKLACLFTCRISKEIKLAASSSISKSNGAIRECETRREFQRFTTFKQSVSICTRVNPRSKPTTTPSRTAVASATSGLVMPGIGLHQAEMNDEVDRATPPIPALCSKREIAASILILITSPSGGHHP